LGKPVIFAQFDHDKFFSGQHVYKKGYIDYEKNGFGDVTYSLDETVNAIIEYVNNNCKIKDKYLQRINEFFKWRDNNNSERVFNEIKKLH
jgi:CDP-glycerol glycerophosphotransferase (TagB/SpsB family)